jgi:hypothetical protein
MSSSTLATLVDTRVCQKLCLGLVELTIATKGLWAPGYHLSGGDWIGPIWPDVYVRLEVLCSGPATLTLTSAESTLLDHETPFQVVLFALSPFHPSSGHLLQYTFSRPS